MSGYSERLDGGFQGLAFQGDVFQGVLFVFVFISVRNTVIIPLGAGSRVLGKAKPWERRWLEFGLESGLESGFRSVLGSEYVCVWVFLCVFLFVCVFSVCLCVFLAARVWESKMMAY